MAKADRSGPIGLRLALAFVGVAVSAVALFGLLSAVLAAREVSTLARSQRIALTQALEVATADAWQRNRGWSMAELQPAVDLAAKIGARIQVIDQAGRTVASSPGYARATGPLGQAAIVSRGRQIGTIQARFGKEGMGSPHRKLRATLWQALASPVGIAALLALAVALLVSRRISKPITRQAGHEALLDGVVEPTPAQLSSLRDEVVRLAKMVDDLQTLASAEAAALQLNARPRDLAEKAQTAAGSMQTTFEASELTLDTKLSPAPVLADERRMHQVVTNLLSNAAKFTPAGGNVTLAVSQNDGHATLTVSDSGVGIP